MKNIEKGSIKHLILQIIIMIIVGLIVIPVLDFLYDTLIVNTPFVYNVQEHIIDPIGLGTVMGIIYWLIDRRSTK